MDKTILQPEYFVLFFMALWVVVSVIISRIGGWPLLSEYYGATDPFAGTRWRFQSAQMRWKTNYNGCSTIGTNTQGLSLSVLFLFRPGHPPLFIPWRDISMNFQKGTVFNYIDFTFLKGPSIKFRVRERLGQKIALSADVSQPDVQDFFGDVRHQHHGSRE